MDRVIASLNASGYGLTLGLHSRIESVADYVAEHARVGNLYVNRNQIGAVVGVQPFGGEGLSGTGPKAGRAELSDALCNRTHPLNRHHLHRRQHDVAVRRQRLTSSSQPVIPRAAFPSPLGRRCPARRGSAKA